MDYAAPVQDPTRSEATPEERPHPLSATAILESSRKRARAYEEYRVGNRARAEEATRQYIRGKILSALDGYLNEAYDTDTSDEDSISFSIRMYRIPKESFTALMLQVLAEFNQAPSPSSSPGARYVYDIRGCSNWGTSSEPSYVMDIRTVPAPQAQAPSLPPPPLPQDPPLDLERYCADHVRSCIAKKIERRERARREAREAEIWAAMPIVLATFMESLEELHGRLRYREEDYPIPDMEGISPDRPAYLSRFFPKPPPRPEDAGAGRAPEEQARLRECIFTIPHIRTVPEDIVWECLHITLSSSSPWREGDPYEYYIMEGEASPVRVGIRKVGPRESDSDT